MRPFETKRAHFYTLLDRSMYTCEADRPDTLNARSSDAHPRAPIERAGPPFVQQAPNVSTKRSQQSVPLTPGLNREENSNGSIADIFPNIFRTNCHAQFVPCFPRGSGSPLAWPKTALIDMMAWYADHLAFIEPNGIQEVSGSIPLISTKEHHDESCGVLFVSF